MPSSAAHGGSWRSHPLVWMALPLGYTALVLLRMTVIPTMVQTAIWPTNGLFAAGVMLLHPKGLRRCLALSLLLLPAPSLLSGGDMGRAAVNLAEAWALGLAARQVFGTNPDFSRGGALVTLGAGVIFPVAAASSGLLYLFAGERLHITSAQAMSWFVGHGLGALVFMPAAIILLDRRRFAAVTGSVLQLALSLAALAAAAVLFFLFKDRSLAVLVFPLAMLITFRHGPVGSAAAALLLSALALVYIYGFAAGHVADASVFSTVQWVQLFVAMVLVTTLPAAGAIAVNGRMRTLLARRTAVAQAARKRADEAAAAKGEFLANLSHEIRTPLNGVIGLADALSRTKLDASQRDLLKMVLASGKALTTLLSDALDLARADSGALRLSVEPMDVRQVIGEAAYLFESLAREKGIGFSVDFDLDAPGACADSLRIKQIVSNLISNAVKFTERGEVAVQVSYKLTGDAGTLAVSVRDTGPGFDQAMKARLFQRFEQADASVTRRHGGSGLGLSIAYKLARLMQGSLAGDATPGAGAVFTFTAPLARADLPAASDAVEELMAQPQTERPLMVLVAEDNLINQKVLQATIGGMVELTMVENGEAAIEAFHQARYDVILMDTHMPVLDGLSAIRRIRAEEAAGGLARTPIISLTADAMRQQVDAAKAAGADLHVAKPITAESLIRALQACLSPREPAAASSAA